MTPPLFRSLDSAALAKDIRIHRGRHLHDPPVDLRRQRAGAGRAFARRGIHLFDR
jgi:hypothetical protein